MVEWVKWFVMDSMGERVSDGGIVVIVCHGDMGLMFFFSCVEWGK